MIENLVFWGHLLTFEPKLQLKVGRTEMMLKQSEDKFEKVEKTALSSPKMIKMQVSIWQKVQIFSPIFNR